MRKQKGNSYKHMSTAKQGTITIDTPPMMAPPRRHVHASAMMNAPASKDMIGNVVTSTDRTVPR